MTRDHDCVISENASVRDALRMLNEQGGRYGLTLFAVGENGSVTGSVTDGDIRRRLVEGLDISQPVSSVMKRDFQYLNSNDISVKALLDCRERGINLIPVLDSEGRLVDVVNLREQLSYLPIDAVLMAGGKGERLRPLTENTPKPLLKVGEKAIIDYNVERLAAYGVRDIHVTVNYLAEQIKDHFAVKTRGAKVECVTEPRFLGTMGSVRLIDDYKHDVVLVMNSDLFTNIDFEAFYLHFIEHGADMAAAAVPYVISVPLGIFDLEGREIKGVIEKPTYSYYANAGIYLMRREVLGRIPKDMVYNATDLIEDLAKEGKKVVRFPIAGYWVDIGKPEEYRRACELARHLSPSPLTSNVNR